MSTGGHHLLAVPSVRAREAHTVLAIHGGSMGAACVVLWLGVGLCTVARAGPHASYAHARVSIHGRPDV